MSKPKQLYWIGARDHNGQPLEFFGAVAGVREPIPARDLEPDEVAALTEAQWECIESETGKRLYSGSEPSRKPSPSTAAKAELSGIEGQLSATTAHEGT